MFLTDANPRLRLSVCRLLRAVCDRNRDLTSRPVSRAHPSDDMSDTLCHQELLFPVLDIWPMFYHLSIKVIIFIFLNFISHQPYISLCICLLRVGACPAFKTLMCLFVNVCVCLCNVCQRCAQDIEQQFLHTPLYEIPLNINRYVMSRWWQSLVAM